MVSAVLLHWLATWICVAVGLPWVKYLFGSMPTAMVGLARPLGFVLIGVGIWSCAMLGLVPFNGGGVIFAAVVIGYIGWRRAGGIDNAWLRAHWRTWALSEVFFYWRWPWWSLSGAVTLIHGVPNARWTMRFLIV